MGNIINQNILCHRISSPLNRRDKRAKKERDRERDCYGGRFLKKLNSCLINNNPSWKFYLRPLCFLIITTPQFRGNSSYAPLSNNNPSFLRPFSVFLSRTHLNPVVILLSPLKGCAINNNPLGNPSYAPLCVFLSTTQSNPVVILLTPLKGRPIPQLSPSPISPPPLSLCSSMSLFPP